MVNNAKRWGPRGLWPYGVAVGAVAIAFCARELLHPFLESHMPAVFFTIAAVAVGFSLGIRPAIVVVILGWPLADYFFVPPFEELAYLDKDDVILILAFPCVTLLFLMMIERLRRTQYEARLIAEVAKSRHDMLLRAEQRRVRAEKSILISNRLLRNLTEDHANVLYIGRVGSRYEYVSELLSRELDGDSCDTETETERLLAALYPEDAKRLALHLQTTGDTTGRVLKMRLPRRNKRLGDLACQVETFPTADGDYVVMRSMNEDAA